LAIEISPFIKTISDSKAHFSCQATVKTGYPHDEAHRRQIVGMKAARLDVSTINSGDDFVQHI
jgi:hypothetical protein